jgi:hypothetical protein
MGGGATGSTAAVKPDGAEEDPKEPVAEEASVAAARPPGVGAGTGEAKGVEVWHQKMEKMPQDDIR